MKQVVVLLVLLQFTALVFGQCTVSSTVPLTNPFGSFGCPAGISNGVTMEWVVTPNNGPITFSIVTLNLGYSAGVPVGDATVNIYDGVDNTGTLLATYTTSNIRIPSPQTTTGDSLYVVLQSSSNNGVVDFTMSYQSLGDPCGTSSSVTLVNPSGVFGCDGLANSVTSSWLINPENGVLILEFTSLNLTSPDMVQIYDGTTVSDTLVGTFTGSTLSGTVYYASSGVFLVVVTTDASIQSNGFKMLYSSGIGDPCLSDYNLNLTNSVSGSFGCANGIQNDIDSYWSINVPSTENYIIAKFLEFNLEIDADYLYVYDGTSTSSPLLANLTGPNIPENIQSTGRDLLFVLHTDSKIRSTGFYVSYTSIETNPCTSDQSITLTQNSDSFGCTNGIAANVDSTWLIVPDNAGIIKLSFSVFNLVGSDTLKVYDGSSTSNTLIGSFTGTTVPSDIISTSSSLLVVLQTVSSNSNGFRASYTTNVNDPCYTSIASTLTNSASNFGCPNGVGTNVDSTWLLTPLDDGLITITIEFYDLSTNTLSIYDSATKTQLIAQYSGSGTRVTLTSTTSTLFVEIETSASTSSNGFEINYITSIPPTSSPNPAYLSPTRSPINFSFSSSRSPLAASASKTPVSITPFVFAQSASRAASSAPSLSPIPASNSNSPSAIGDVTSSPSVTAAVTPSVSITPAITPSTSVTPLFVIVPFSPSNTPTAVATILPNRVVSDVETVSVKLTCEASVLSCCENFQLLWGTSVTENYPNLVDVFSCNYIGSNVTVQYQQYGSYYFTSDDILKSYWSSAGCSQQDPLSGEICVVTGSSLDQTLYTVDLIEVSSVVVVSPSPLPSFYYYEPPSSDASSFATFSSFLLFIVVVAHLM